MAHDEKMKEEFVQKTKDLKIQIAELRALIAASNIHSPILSDKASCPGEKEEEQEQQKNVKKKKKLQRN